MPQGISVFPRALEGSRAILRVKDFCILPWISRPNKGYLWVSGQVSDGGTGIEGPLLQSEGPGLRFPSVPTEASSFLEILGPGGWI